MHGSIALVTADAHGTLRRVSEVQRQPGLHGLQLEHSVTLLLVFSSAGQTGKDPRPKGDKDDTACCPTRGVALWQETAHQYSCCCLARSCRAFMRASAAAAIASRRAAMSRGAAAAGLAPTLPPPPPPLPFEAPDAELPPAFPPTFAL